MKGRLRPRAKTLAKGAVTEERGRECSAAVSSEGHCTEEWPVVGLAIVILKGVSQKGDLAIVSLKGDLVNALKSSRSSDWPLCV